MTQNDYNTCVMNFSDDVYRFILKNNKNSNNAKDIVQMAYEVLWEKRDLVTLEKAKSYLFTVAYRKLIDEYRKQQRVTYQEEIKEHLGGSTITENNDLKNLLNKALETLPAIQKQLVLLKDYEGYNYDELATITGLNESQVKVYLFRARTSLKKTLVSLELHI